MSRLHFFLTPEAVFEALRSAKLAEGTRLIFRRFSRNGFDAHIQTVDLADDRIASTYISEGYTEYYVSLGGTPENSTDWGFMDRSADELLVFEGGRLVDGDLEITKLRIFSKRSRATTNFTAVKRAVLARCDKKGVVTSSGAIYEDVFYAPEAEQDYRLRLSMATESDDFVCHASSPTN